MAEDQFKTKSKLSFVFLCACNDRLGEIQRYLSLTAMSVLNGIGIDAEKRLPDPL